MFPGIPNLHWPSKLAGCNRTQAMLTDAAISRALGCSSGLFMSSTRTHPAPVDVCPTR
jgi:hypothetical protein